MVCLRRQSRGFTLVELMVVAGVLAILSAIIGPALYDAKTAAKRSACAFNLRQMGIGVSTYVTDYDGFYPQTKGHSSQQPQIDDASGAIETPDRGSPLRNIGPYTTGIADCPSDPDPDGELCASVTSANFLTTSYLVNGYFVWGINEEQVRSSAETVYLAERRSNAVGVVPPNCDVIFRPWYNPSNPSAPWNDMDPKTGAIATERHREGANYLFVDGHGKFFPFEDVWSPPKNDFMTP